MGIRNGKVEPSQVGIGSDGWGASTGKRCLIIEGPIAVIEPKGMRGSLSSNHDTTKRDITSKKDGDIRMDLSGPDGRLSPQKWARFLITQHLDHSEHAQERFNSMTNNLIEIIGPGIMPTDVDGRVPSKAGWGTIPWSHRKDSITGPLPFDAGLLNLDEKRRTNKTMAFELNFKKIGIYRIAAYSSNGRARNAVYPASLTMTVLP